MQSQFSSELLRRVERPLLAVPLAAPNGPNRTVNAQLLDVATQVRCSHGELSTQLVFADGSCARVSSDGTQIDVLDVGAQFEAVLWGPLLLLALARRDVFCLHASAFCIVPGAAQVQVMLGFSGVGKSTLARIAADHGGQAVADDLCALSLDARQRPCLHPRLPQLKWATTAHWPASAAPEVPVHRLGLLQRGAVAQINQASDGALLRALLTHTVATRLFEPTLLQRHLAFCAALATQLQSSSRGLSCTVREDAAAPHSAMLELLHLLG